MDSIRWVVDRIEDRTWVVLIREPAASESEEAETRTLRLSTLPPGIREGDVLRERPPGMGDSEDTARFALDPEGKALRLGRLEALRQNLRRGPSGPFRI
jgi:hypothetical protein